MSIKNSISSRQAIFLILTCILATVDVFLPTEVAHYAGRDAWISALLAPLIGLVIYKLIIRLTFIYPNLTLAGMSRKILGKYLGSLLTIFYILSYILFCILVVIQFAIIMSTSFKPESPPYAWHLILLLPSLFVAALGIHVPARMNEILLPLGLMLLVVVSVLNIPNINLKEYLPVFQYGYRPAIEGAVVTAGRLTYSMVLLSLMPMVSNHKKLSNHTVPGYIIISSALLIGTMSIPIIGLKTTEATLVPALMMFRVIDVGFLSRMDPIMMAIWHMGFFIFLAVFLYSAAILTKELMNLKGYRNALYIISIVVVIGANAYITNVPLIRDFLQLPITILLFVLSFFIPLMLYIVAIIKGEARAK